MSETPFEAIIISQVCLFRECLSQALANDPVVRILEVCAGIDHALDSIESLHPSMILLDAAFDGGASVAASMHRAYPEVQIVAVALPETEDDILTWAEAGIAGYVPDTASMREFPRFLKQIRWGEQACPSRIAGSLLRGLARRWNGDETPPKGARIELTPRERVILRHISAGLSNKDIARELDISLGTAKSHVHNIFGKLNLRSRAQVAARMGRGMFEDFRLEV